MKKGFEYLEKVSMIISDSTAHGGYAFHPANAEPPVADGDNGEDGNNNNNNRDSNIPINPSAVQAVVTSALATASLATNSQFPTDTLSSGPLSSTLVDSLNPDSAMDINPVPKTMSNHPPTVSPPASISGVHKQKVWSFPHSALPSVISVTPSAPSSFTPSSSNPLSSNSHVKHQKAFLPVTPTLFQPFSSSSTRGCSVSIGLGKPSRQRGTSLKANTQLANFNDTLDHMTSVMENQNLIFQVPVPVPVDQVAKAHSHVLKSIQNNMSGAFALEERGKIISDVISNPAAATTYEQLLFSYFTSNRTNKQFNDTNGCDLQFNTR